MFPPTHSRSRSPKDNIGIFIGFDGRPTRNVGLAWSDPPLALTFSYPYVLALLPRGVEVWLAVSQSLVQTVAPQAGGGACTLAVSTRHCAMVSNGTSITRLVPVPIASQVDELVARKEYSDAITLCSCIPDAHAAERDARLADIRYLAY